MSAEEPSNQTIYALLQQHCEVSQQSHERIEAHFDRLNNQVEKNTRFRYMAKVWFTILGFIAIAVGGIINIVMSKWLIP